MEVDPFTGLPMVGNTPDASSVAGQVGINTLEAQGITEGPIIGALAHIPSVFSTMGWNALRGSNTIMRGGANPGFVSPNMIRGAASQHLNPRSWTRFTDASVIDPVGGKGYSPFNFMAWGGDSIMKGLNKTASGAEFIAKRGFASENNEYFSRGMLSRVSAGNRYARMARQGISPGISGIQNVNTFLGRTNPALQSGWNRSLAMAGGNLGNAATDLAQMSMMSARGTVSQAIGGYMAGASVGGTTQATRTALESGGGQVALRYADAAGRHLARGGLAVENGTLRIASTKLGEQLAQKTGMKIGQKAGLGAASQAIKLAGSGGAKTALALGGRAAGLAIPGINIAMAAWMAYDLTKMGASLLSEVPRFAQEAVTSVKGSISKPIMGMGFTDNTVAATSRARGVQAIASSRLNARSALGTEGAMMSAHFG